MTDPPPRTVGDLRAAAGTRTSPAIETAVGILLGAAPDTSRAAVGVLLTADRLGTGLALPALLLAARRGTDASGAIAALADGAPVPDSWSDYERRTAEEEADEDLRLSPPAPGAPLVVCRGPEAPVAAAAAVAGGGGGGLSTDAAVGHLAEGLALRRAFVDAAWIAALASAAGWPLPDHAVGAVAEELRTVLAGPAHAALPVTAGDGVDGTVPRSAAALAVPRRPRAAR
jgi:hypothetical protein